MNTWVWIVVAILVVVLLLTFVGRRAVGGVDPTQLLLEPDLVGRVRALAVAGQRIQAIKLLREGTPGLGLAAAKLMVDRMARPGASAQGSAAATAAGSPIDLTKGSDPGNLDLTPSSSAVPMEVELEARSLKSAGQKIQAIKLVRTHTNWDLRTAKGYVDGL